MRSISADLFDEEGARSPFAALCVGAGRANEALRRDFMEQLAATVRDCGFRYLRFHGLFHDDMGVYREDENGNPLYNWQYIDTLFDSLLEIGVRPFVELSFTPRAMASGDKTVFWWHGNVTPPAELSRWGGLVEAFVQHFVDRYGYDEVNEWFFEVWNEPDYPAFFSAGMAEYFAMYDAAARAVKSVSPLFRVGGPATSEGHWLPEFLAHCAEEDVPVDFVSTHTYGVEGALDEYGTNMQILLEDRDAIVKAVEKARREIDESPLPELPLYYTEWSASYSSRDNVHDSYVSAPFILYNLRRLAGTVEAMSYWTFTDIFEEGGPGPTPFHGGFGLRNLQGLKKPAYYAYEFLNALGSRELACADPDAWICREEDDVQALVWNYTKPEQAGVPNQLYFTRDLPPQGHDTVNLTLESMTPGSYLLTCRRVGYREGDVFDAYRDLGCPETLTRGQTAALERMARCREEHQIVTVDGTFEYEFPLAENEVCLIELKKL